MHALQRSDLGVLCRFAGVAQHGEGRGDGEKSCSIIVGGRAHAASRSRWGKIRLAIDAVVTNKNESAPQCSARRSVSSILLRRVRATIAHGDGAA